MGFLPYTHMKFIDLSFPTFRFKKRNKQTKRPFSRETGFMEFSDLAKLIFDTAWDDFRCLFFF